MKITRDVVTDLWPLYASGDASADSRSLVEEFLREDPEFERLLRSSGSATFPPPPASALPRDHESESLARAKKHIRRRAWLLAFAIFFTGVPLSFAWSSDGGILWFMLRDNPVSAAIYLSIGAVLWIVYAIARRRLRTTGV